MSLEIKLDTNALASLIDSDPEFKLKVQQSVLANIANRYLKDSSIDFSEAIKAAANSAKAKVLEEYGSYDRGYPPVFKLNQQTSDHITTKTRALAKATADAEISKIIDDEIATRMKSIEDIITAKIAVGISRQTDQMINAAVKTKIESTVNTMLSEILVNKLQSIGK